MTKYAPSWLQLREDADAVARATELIEPVRAFLRGQDEVVIRDLGCGTGSLGRWLARRLPGRQRWILHDRDTDLLTHALARTSLPDHALDGSEVTVVTEQRDITELRAEDLAGTSLVAASALLDLLTAEEMSRLAEACVEAGCAVLFTLSVSGRVVLSPKDKFDIEISDAFNAHQRRVTDGRWLLGPDAVDVAFGVFERLGATVRRAPSPWRLGAEQAALTAEWLTGWVGAACEQRPELAADGDAYLRWRLAQCAAGELDAMIQHEDLLVVPA
ncbi:SAM-dependent methyltransferase [Amycolatopsis sp. WAC 04182]|uniref:class I SAM-dependent methyltransferase n=1 Tax=Amycolatopsis sp. WAC 04182 TaxID=2203198 RepID=UPI000F78B496|nr:class I SAM-dependent methyltransferase [Amycolatopsis sp. WAC 04182]RSN56003.1 SAM-dependent methyltransferase [Amycolatopsis sp. WAC 04182]